MSDNGKKNGSVFGASAFGPRLHSDPLCRVVLVEPLIPENTGNISRTCVGTQSELHLVEPMGFEINESRVKRAGLDYWADLAWLQHKSYGEWRKTVPDSSRIFFIETGGTKSIFDAEFRRGDWLVFGKETAGLDQSLIEAEHDAFAWHLPMPGPTRSLNLSNAVAVSVFELMRQVNFRK
jgi:tRNA (cytidine/uridine-2'-O-)-methyltransferase